MERSTNVIAGDHLVGVAAVGEQGRRDGTSYIMFQSGPGRLTAPAVCSDGLDAFGAQPLRGVDHCLQCSACFLPAARFQTAIRIDPQLFRR